MNMNQRHGSLPIAALPCHAIQPACLQCVLPLPFILVYTLISITMSCQYPNNHGSYPMPCCSVWAMYAAHGAQYHIGRHDMTVGYRQSHCTARHWRHHCVVGVYIAGSHYKPGKMSIFTFLCCFQLLWPMHLHPRLPLISLKEISGVLSRGNIP